MWAFGVRVCTQVISRSDLRATVAAVLRLPFDADKPVDILCGPQPSAANNPSHEEHTTFWFVVADQYRVRSKALTIIDSGADIATLERLGILRNETIGIGPRQ
jgi:hypothetical protein